MNKKLSKLVEECAEATAIARKMQSYDKDEASHAMLMVSKLADLQSAIDQVLRSIVTAEGNP